MMSLCATTVYFGWLWYNRGAVEYRQLLDSIHLREKVKRRKALKRRVMKKLERRSKISPRFDLKHSVEQEFRTTP
ncbi:MAG TPA: hypothetical protein VLX61_03205 [Anaerolineales bacterium]|nr:hypothetical protein [Anaerolineales bacterium]